MVFILTGIAFGCLFLSASYGMKIQEVTGLVNRIATKVKLTKT